jgi:TRAP-type C4-dicarboxylate transport system substrate-binding protein
MDTRSVLARPSARRTLAGTVLILAAVMAHGRAAPAAPPEYVLHANTALTPDDPIYKGLERFGERVGERTEFSVAVTIYPRSQLGKDEAVLELARAGAPVAVVVDGGRLARFQNEFGILQGPFLAKGYAPVRRIVTSDLFRDWADKLRAGSNLQVLAFNWWQGERHLLTNKPVRTPADLAGLKIRTPGAPVWTETVAAMGGIPAPSGWTEVHSLLKEGRIDGAEAQLSAVYGAKLYEVVNTVTETGHINLISGLVTSGSWFDSLPLRFRTILIEEAVAAGDMASRMIEASEKDFERKLTEKGMTVATVDTTPFRTATQKVYEKLGYTKLHKIIEEQLLKE